MAANREAPIGAGRYGLIVMSHGTGGGRLNHRDTSIRLAESGYVVAAPEHAGDNFRDKRYSGTSENWRRRPRQLSAVWIGSSATPISARTSTPGVSVPSGTQPAATACSP